jgi:hypothetical protein
MMLGNVLLVLHTLSAWASLSVHVIPDTIGQVLPVSRTLLSKPALLGCHYLSVVCNVDRAWSGPPVLYSCPSSQRLYVYF